MIDAIDAMKTNGWLVVEAIKPVVRFKGQGLKVDWSRTPWPAEGGDTPANPDEDKDRGVD